MEVHNCTNLHLKFVKTKIPSSFMLLVSFFFLFFPFTSSTSPENFIFNFASFAPNEIGRFIELEGDATTANQAIQLTTNLLNKKLNDSIGRATYIEPMHLWDKVSGNVADFNTHFSFVIDSQNKSSYADGFAFFLATNGSKLTSAATSGGGNLALLDRNRSIDYDNYSFVAVEFDTYPNVGIDEDSYEHVGIDLNNMTSLKTAPWRWNDIKNGRKAEAWISYNSSSHNLSVLLVDAEDNSYPKQNSTSLNCILNLKDHLPEWVTFGFSGATGSEFEVHTIYSWEFSSSLQVADNQIIATVAPVPSPSTSPRSSKKWYVLALAVGGGTLVFVSFIFGLVWFCCWIKRNRSEKGHTTYIDAEIEGVRGARKFSFKELVIATNKFADERLLGEGGFGRVYLGFLKDINSNVAVKRITPQSKQGIKEYASELKTIGQLIHRNLVKLIGWCHERHEFIIVYEFMPKKSLDFHLFVEPGSLTWEMRYNIALGLASALFYLQEQCEQCVLHRDIKSSNVLLDSNFNAKLGDFGLARIVDHGQDAQTTVLLGTEGYVAPEYRESWKASKESDIYSFGIVILEIACGKKATGEIERNGEKYRMKLVDWVWEQYRLEDIFSAADPRLGRDYDAQQMEALIIVGLACGQPNRENRPSIRQALDMLNFKAPLPVLPQEMPLPKHYATHVANVYASPGSSFKASSASSNTASLQPTSSSTASNSTCSVQHATG